MTVWFVVVLRVLQSSGCFGRLAIATCRFRPFWLTRCWRQTTEITHLHLIPVFRLYGFTWIQVTAQECPCSEPCDDTLILSLYLDSTLVWNGKLTSPTSFLTSGSTSKLHIWHHFYFCFFISSSHLRGVLTERQQNTKGSGSWDHTCCNSGQCVDISTHVHYYISTHVAKCKKLQFL